MRKDDAVSILRSNADRLRAIGVAHIGLFGSVARDTAAAHSDIDLVLAGPPERPMTLFSMARAEAVLEQVLGRPVDLTPAQGLEQAPGFRDRIAGELTWVF